MKPNRLRLTVAALSALNLLGLSLPGFAELVVDRGLPTANLNSAAGANRSNVSISYPTVPNPPDPDVSFFAADDFTLNTPVLPTQSWTIDTIRVWVVGDGTTPLGDIYSNLSLYSAALPTTTLSQVAATTIGAGGNTSSNPNVTITPVTYSGGADYEGATFHQIYQVDFNNLGLTYAPGTGPTVRFGIYGVDSLGDSTYSHASNAGLSGSPQDDADGLYHIYYSLGLTAPEAFPYVDAVTEGIFDKVADINVQAWGTVPETTTYVGWGVMAMVLGGGMYLRRRQGNRA